MRTTAAVTASVCTGRATSLHARPWQLQPLVVLVAVVGNDGASVWCARLHSVALMCWLLVGSWGRHVDVCVAAPAGLQPACCVALLGGCLCGSWWRWVVMVVFAPTESLGTHRGPENNQFAKVAGRMRRAFHSIARHNHTPTPAPLAPGLCCGISTQQTQYYNTSCASVKRPAENLSTRKGVDAPEAGIVDGRFLRLFLASTLHANSSQHGSTAQHTRAAKLGRAGVWPEKVPRQGEPGLEPRSTVFSVTPLT